LSSELSEVGHGVASNAKYSLNAELHKCNAHFHDFDFRATFELCTWETFQDIKQELMKLPRDIAKLNQASTQLGVSNLKQRIQKIRDTLFMEDIQSNDAKHGEEYGYNTGLVDFI